MKIISHKVKYPRWLNIERLIGLCIVFGEIIFSCIKIITISTRLEIENIHSIKTKLIIIISLSIIIILLTTTYYTLTSRISPFFTQQITAKLYHVIRTNKLYKQDEFKRVFSSVIFKFWYNEQILFIECHSNGEDFTKKLSDLNIQLQSALKLPLLELDNSNPNYVKYQFSLSEIQRLSFSKREDFLKGASDVIALDSHRNWAPYKSPHLLIAGKTGGGKTYQILILILQTAYLGWDIRIADPKRSDLASLKGCFPENHVATTPSQIAKLTREVVEIMNGRYSNYFENSDSKLGTDYRAYKLQPILLIFDEIASFMSMDKKIGVEVMGYLKQIIMMGRQAGVFLLMSTQRPDADALDTAIRDQFSVRIALGKMSNMGYKMVLGNYDELPNTLWREEKGSGYILIDGEDWSTPRPYRSAILDLEDLDYRETLTSFLMSNKRNNE